MRDTGQPPLPPAPNEALFWQPAAFAGMDERLSKPEGTHDSCLQAHSPLPLISSLAAGWLCLPARVGKRLSMLAGTAVAHMGQPTVAASSPRMRLHQGLVSEAQPLPHARTGPEGRAVLLAPAFWVQSLGLA